MTSSHLLGMVSIKLTRQLWRNSFQTSLIAVQSSPIFAGFFSWTNLFRWSHIFSIGSRSGDWAGHSITVTFSLWNHCCTNLDVWHVALSCWNIQFLGIDSVWVDWMSGFSRIPIYPSPSILPLTVTKRCRPFPLMQPHAMIPQAPCVTLDRMQLCHNASPAILCTQTWPSDLCSRNLDSSLKMTLDHILALQSLCDLVNCR